MWKLWTLPPPQGSLLLLIVWLVVYLENFWANFAVCILHDMWPQKSQLSLVIGWWMDKDCLMSDTDKSPSFCHRLHVHLETRHPHSARQFRLCSSFHFLLVQSLKVSQRLELRPSQMFWACTWPLHTCMAFCVPKNVLKTFQSHNGGLLPQFFFSSILAYCLHQWLFIISGSCDKNICQLPNLDTGAWQAVVHRVARVRHDLVAN